MCLQVSPRRRRFARSTDMPFQADATRQRLTIPVKRDVLYLVVVDDIRLCSRIRIRIELLFARGTCTGDHRGVDHLEIAVRLIAPLDEESSVVQLRLRRPRNHDLTGVSLSRTGRKCESSTGNAPPGRKPGVPTSFAAP